MSKTTTKPAKVSDSATVTIGGTDYELVLTTAATREIAKRYGGLENLGTALETSNDLAATLGEVTWLITLLANQSVKIHNLTHPGEPKPELTVEAVELLTVPADLTDYRAAITEALHRGTRREIQVETDPKDTPTPGV